MYVPPIVLGGLAVLWLATSRLRRPQQISELLANIHPDLANRLVPFIEQQVFESDRRLNEAIGGWRGMLEIYRHAGYIVSIVHLLANGQKVKEAPELEEILLSTIYIRYATPFCLLESAIPEFLASANRAAQTNINIPHIGTWGYARLYCDMVSSLNAALAEGSPSPGRAQFIPA
jgi:hypothetical protein